MKRRRLLITGVLLLQGGAIVNVAVAWGRALWAADPARERQTTTWPSAVPAEWPASAKANVKSAFGITEIHARNDENVQWVFQAGVPMRSLECIRQRTENYFLNYIAISLHKPTHWRHGIEPPEFLRDWNKTRFLPLIPIWPGFAINTIFYAAMLWVVFFVPGMVRRRIRRRRGLCPACAYPIGSSPVCTECGKALA